MKPQEPNTTQKTTEEALAEMKEFAKSLGINLIEGKPPERKKTASIHFVNKPKTSQENIDTKKGKT